MALESTLRPTASVSRQHGTSQSFPRARERPESNAFYALRQPCNLFRPVVKSVADSDQLLTLNAKAVWAPRRIGPAGPTNLSELDLSRMLRHQHLYWPFFWLGAVIESVTRCPCIARPRPTAARVPSSQLRVFLPPPSTTPQTLFTSTSTSLVLLVALPSGGGGGGSGL